MCLKRKAVSQNPNIAGERKCVSNEKWCPRTLAQRDEDKESQTKNGVLEP